MDKCLFSKEGNCSRLSTTEYRIKISGWNMNFKVCEIHEKKTISEIREEIFKTLRKQEWNIKPKKAKKKNGKKY